MRITIGIPCYSGVSPETLEDYMRFAYHLGRRYQEHEFFLAIKSKSEQYRARNAIIEAAVQVGSQYLLMLDDDQVIEWEESSSVSDAYEFLRKMLVHMEDDPSLGILGALYYQRGGDVRPVLMQAHNEGFRFLRDDEIEGRLQSVDVAGGGAMLINCQIFNRIAPPYFRPEADAGFGTDIQICRATAAAGFSVKADTSLVIGHVMSQRVVVTPKTRYRIMAENGAKWQDVSQVAGKRLASYRKDVEDFVGLAMEDMEGLALEYRGNLDRINDFESKEAYYAQLGKGQLARQLHYHHKPEVIEWDELLLTAINHSRPWRILDYGCGSAPATFELLKKGHHVDFVDIDGSTSYEFLKHRVKRHGLNANAGFEFKGPYDFLIFADSLEHFEDWKGILGKSIASLAPDGALLTNYFLNRDFSNPEHVSMDHDAVRAFLTSMGMYPMNELVWIPMSPKEVNNEWNTFANAAGGPVGRVPEGARLGDCSDRAGNNGGARPAPAAHETRGVPAHVG